MKSAAADPRKLVLLFLVLAVAGVGAVWAHEFSLTVVRVDLFESRTYRIDVVVDVDALALGVSPSTDSNEVKARLEAMSPEDFDEAMEQARSTLVRRLRVRFDGEKQRPLVIFPDHGSALNELSEIPTLLGTTARLTGVIPEGAQEFTFGASRTFKQVQLTIVDEVTGTETSTLLDVSEDYGPYLLGEIPEPPGALETFSRYLALGFEHILPKGLDHILFVLGLFLLSPRTRPLLWQVTGFTLAHTVTLALSVYGVISAPAWIVEPLIALSIAYVAIENLFTQELKPWRPLLVFGFGLLHGMGFAGVLEELGLPQGQFLTAVLSFNIGVELGQLAVIVAAFLLVGWYRGSEHYRKRVTIPASLLIAAVGLFWSVQRVLGG